MSEDLHALSGAYVLDALDAEERAAFEAYMATSPATAAEVASLLEATLLLAGGAALTPPEGLKRAVMTEIDAVRQERPVVTPIADAPSRRAPSQPTSRTGWMPRMLSAVAAVAIAAAIGLGATVVGLSSRLNDVEETYGQVAVLLAAPDTVRSEGSLAGGGIVTAVLSPNHGALVLAEGLPTLPEDQVYALWGLADTGPVPIGELQNGRPVTVPTPYTQVGLTVEPRGPLDLPTGVVQLTLGA